jgi:acyl-CoA reductase-like NAD-dependent aldehyde dehydrogenase
MLVAGEWVDSTTEYRVVSPYSGETVDTVPVATSEHVERALAAAELGAAAMAALTAYERSEILRRAADLLEDRVEEIARTLSLEEGKPLVESRVEVGRSPDLLRLCGFEAAHVRGETLPLDAAPNGAGKIGMTMRVPCGVVVAITPFNYPLLLVLHKVGPALAAGNAVVLKPAGQTPLTALKLTEILVEAGLPPLGLQCVTGSGSMIGPMLCGDPRVRKISFTGSAAVGEEISHVAGIKRLSLELGANCPLIVLPGADIDRVIDTSVVGGYTNAGQVCISTQRILVDRGLYGDVLDALVPRVEAIPLGDPLDENTRLGAMVSAGEAGRVQEWINEAVDGGAHLVTGAERDGAVLSPAVVADVDRSMRIFQEELFGPAVAVTPVAGIEDAIAAANDSAYGLGAAVFTDNLDVARRFVTAVDAGNLHINGGPLWRADLMPYGGLKRSGIGKEGPRYAVEEMTELKTVVIH